jgi:uncharacterized protein (TIRG00374 family)
VQTRPKKYSLRLAFRVVLGAIGLGLFGHVLWANRGSFHEVFGHRPDLRYFALAYLLYLSALVWAYARWYVVVRSQGLAFRLLDALKIGFIANAVDSIVPGQIGGDVVKATFLCREQSSRTRAIASVMIDRMLGLLGLFLLASAMGAVNWSVSGPTVRRLIELVWLALAVGMAGFSTVFFPALLRPLERVGASHARLLRVLGELRAVSVAYRDRKAGVALGLAMATVNHALFALSFCAVSKALLPDPPTVLQHLQMVPLVIFTGVVPLPFGALGLSEQVSDELFRMIGHPLGGLTMIGFRVVGLAVTLVNVAFCLATYRGLRSKGAEAIPELAKGG